MMKMNEHTNERRMKMRCPSDSEPFFCVTEKDGRVSSEKKHKSDKFDMSFPVTKTHYHVARFVTKNTRMEPKFNNVHQKSVKMFLMAVWHAWRHF